ncbi:hypothetical protein HH308_25280 [Gordonia sp. TBRC 11910]|uniref:Uncharacterized protein n=1 Tax=Gordonia asplenii TaxID=2725283 RepID=A0A848L244_9ACTN|nr:hypothetical protein [Gordonia asplenii]NMO04537.1 hypothetical protein [Gordonia asplenii]
MTTRSRLAAGAAVVAAAAATTLLAAPASAAPAAYCAAGSSQVHSVSTATAVVRICQFPSGAFQYRGTLRETGHTGVFAASYERVRGYYVARNRGYYYLVWRNAVEVRDPGYNFVSYESAQ